MKIFHYLGRVVIDRLLVARDIWKIILYSLATLHFHLGKGRRAVTGVLLKQIYFTGFQAALLIFQTALIIGLVVVTQSMSILPMIGEERLIGEIMVWVVVRELGPIFAAIIVIARSGSAIASELGTMKMSNEVKALEVMAIDPHLYLVAPRVLGTALSVFMLAFFFEAVSILGGYLLASFETSITFSVYALSVMDAMGPLDVGLSLMKGLVFGLFIGAFSCYHGLKVEGSITQIPQETAKAIIGSLQMVFVVDIIIAVLFYM